MELELKDYDLGFSEPTVLIHEDDYRTIGVSKDDSVRIVGTRSTVAISNTLVPMGCMMSPPESSELVPHPTGP